MITVFRKTVRLGLSAFGNVYCKIQLDKGRLSITGVEGPMRNGDAKGSCGQIVMSKPEIIELAPNWTQEMITKFWELWEQWHLNDMRAGCEHQRAEGWDKKKIDESQPLTQSNMRAWVTVKDDPANGLLNRPCPVCGYKYGSAWLFEEVPQDVLEWLKNLPDTDMTPAWV